MASSSKKHPLSSPAAHRQSRKTNKVNLHAEKNDEIAVVGIGASAGGLKALQKFFEALPSDTGMAYVVITHLHLEHENHLAELLQTRTHMPVRQVNGLILVEKDHVYVIPPNRHLVMQDGQIDLIEFKEPRGQRAPIDYFFGSLASEHPNAVGVILSGGGADGAVGAKAIKEEGGLLMVQHPDEASQTLVQAHDLFYALFDANPIPTALIRRADQVFLHVNVEFLNYFRLQSEEVIGHDAKELSLNLGLDADMQDEVGTALAEEGMVRNLEFEIKHPSGNTRMILASIQFLTLDQTDTLITTFIDITERVNAEQQIRRLASELTAAEQAERHRLAQILHDDLQQRMFAIQMQLSFLKDAYEKNDLEAFQIDFPQLEAWLAESIQVTRQLSVDLSPPVLHGEGLVEATIWLAAQMQEQYGLNVKIQGDGKHAQLDEKVRVLTFYAVRELLFNVVKHSGTLEAMVTFKDHGDYLKVIVSDIGKGFLSQEIIGNQTPGHGLLSLRHRLNLLGCNMEVKSELGDGTQVIIQAPYEQRENQS